MRRRKIAKEWLLFVGLLLIGLVAVPTIMSLIEAGTVHTIGFYEALLDDSDWVFAWAVALSPYVLVQLIRSVLWAIKTVRARDEQ